MQFGNPYYGDFNVPQQRYNSPTNWNKGWDSVRFVNQNYLVGRLIFSPDQITPQEIPTNGTPALFPLNDGSCIYAKSLQPDGTFAEWRYVLDKPVETEKNVTVSPREVKEDDPNSQKASNYDELVKRVDFLEQMLNMVLNVTANTDQNENKEV